MKSLFSGKKDPEVLAREAIRKRKWSKAVAYYEKKAQESERDFALWNLLGDLYMNHKAHAQAVDAWRRALEGYSLEGLHENVLGIARKILRRAPQEDDVHLLLAEAYLGLEYHADCLAALRSYLKLSKQRSENDLRSLFRKILEVPIPHLHLLDELAAIFKDSAVDDYELAQKLDAYVEANRQAAASRQPPKVSAAEEMLPTQEGAISPRAGEDGLLILGGSDAEGDTLSTFADLGNALRPEAPPPPPFPSSFETPASSEREDLPPGEGKDHYDLGMVYKEMRLWDAAITELEQARRDPAVRVRAALALSECMQETHDLQGALELLERECESSDGDPQEKVGLEFQLGIINETLGNLREALEYFEAVRNKNSSYEDVELRSDALRSRLGEE